MPDRASSTTTLHPKPIFLRCASAAEYASGMADAPLLDVVVREARLDEIFELRHRILRAGLPPESARWQGDHDPHTRHFAAVLDGRIVGCATLMLNQWEGQPAWQLRGMAVEDGLRGRGIGRLILQHIERTAREANLARMLWCNARVQAVSFYRSQGWQTVGDEFSIPTAGPHLKMYKPIQRQDS